ncbi:MAG: hypothetical protein LCH84_09935 [Gemmatimonadetes bacterium]|nr:hypothetical protein [Gemmatimonadota bacterium]
MPFARRTTRRSRHLPRALALAAACFAPLAPLASLAAQEALVISDPVPLEKRVEIDKGKGLREMQKIIVPAVILRLSARGSLTVTNQGRFFETDGNTAKATAKFIVGGLDKAYIQGLAKQLQDDFVARLRSAGYTVLTYDDIKSHAEVTGMKRYKPDEIYGVPTGGPTGSKNTYLMAFPSDEQAIDPPFQGYGWGFRKIMKEMDAGLMVPEYLVDAPLLTGSKRNGISSRGASVSVLPEMTVGVYLPFSTPKGGWGWVTLKGPIGDLADSVGTIGEAKDNSPEFANALNKSLSLITGLGGISAKSGVYGMIPDRTLYTNALLRGVVSFHMAAERAIREEKNKP